MKKAIFLVALCLGTLTSAQQLTKEMTVALKNDDTQTLSTLISDANKDACLQVGRTESSITGLAVDMRSSDVLQMLIAKGVDLNNTCGGATPLMRAVNSGQPDLVEILMDAGADPSVNIDGKKAMDLVNGNNATAIKKLLSK